MEIHALSKAEFLSYPSLYLRVSMPHSNNGKIKATRIVSETQYLGSRH